MDFLQKVRQLPAPVRSFFESNEPRILSERVCFLYGLSKDQIGRVTGPSGLIFVGDVHLRDFPEILARDLRVDKGVAYGIAYEMNRRLHAPFPEYFQDAQQLLREWEQLKVPPSITEDEAYKKVLQLEPWIVEDEQEREQEAQKMRNYEKSLEKILLLDALTKYPRLHDGVLSAERIGVKSEREPVRGTVRNWLRAYRDALGVRKHTALERGQFLFQSENGKLLSNEERERVSLVLKSLDENTPLAIDPGRQEIVFPINPGSQAQPAPAQPFQSAPATAHASASSQPPEDIFERRAPRAASVQPTFIPSTLPQSQAQPAQLPKNNFNFSQAAPVQPAGIRFSSGHTLPSEKQEIQQRSFVPEAPVEVFTAPVFANLQAALQAQAPQAHASFEQGKEAVVSAVSQPAVPMPPQYRMPPRIRPAHVLGGQPGSQTDTQISRKEVWEVPAGLANVVDLRSDEENVV